jgi:2-keto-4-pentenoate hydratase
MRAIVGSNPMELPVITRLPPIPSAVPACALLAAALLAACAAPAPVAQALPDVPGCATAAETADLVKRYLALEPVPNPAPPSMGAAACSARKFVAALVPTHGPVAGYKAGLTNPAVQQRFGITTPVRGTLLQKMMLADGATVPARFGARPFVEPDLVVEVGSAAVHDAKSPLEVLASLRSVRPFIELPDVSVVDPSKITGPALVSLNIGARLGVLGAPVPVRADAAFADALRDMTVRSTDSSGKEVPPAKGAAILGHPLNAVIWLAADLKAAGITLKPGDLLSLGAFGNIAAEPGKTVRVVYEGLPGHPSVSVNLR